MKLLRKLAVFTALWSITVTAPCQAGEIADTAKQVGYAPVKVAGCMFGLALGTPIAIARISKRRIHAYREDFADIEDPHNLGNLVMAMPMGIGEGVCSGLFYGPRNAIMAKPFSRESLSLMDNPTEK